jgi:ankyrin repeat protein
LLVPEREIEEEARELERTEKKSKADEERRASAMENTFQVTFILTLFISCLIHLLLKAAHLGNSSAVRQNVIEFDLDVNAPRKRAKQFKQSQKQEDNVQQETLLHAAASYCDETLVMFLVERGKYLSYPSILKHYGFIIGAKPSILNKQQLSPFHAAILAGNTSVVRFIMERRGKSFDGYHPSKAAPSGRTPLQLAIASGVTAMVEFFIKEATTHDVERCWNVESMSDEIRDVLRTKVEKCFCLCFQTLTKLLSLIERFCGTQASDCVKLPNSCIEKKSTPTGISSDERETNCGRT